MSKISIVDLEVFYRIGVTDEERARPQRLLLTVEMNLDFTAAAASDRLDETINYHTLTEQLLRFGEGRSWRLLEKLAADLADFVLAEHRPESTTVEVKKFVIPQARYVSVCLARKGISPDTR
jgi:FolB domain-containing protein